VSILWLAELDSRVAGHADRCRPPSRRTLKRVRLGRLALGRRRLLAPPPRTNGGLRTGSRWSGRSTQGWPVFRRRRSAPRSSPKCAHPDPARALDREFLAKRGAAVCVCGVSPLGHHETRRLRRRGFLHLPGRTPLMQAPSGTAEHRPAGRSDAIESMPRVVAPRAVPLCHAGMALRYRRPRTGPRNDSRSDGVTGRAARHLYRLRDGPVSRPPSPLRG
jgi:hypothetical protein